MLFFKVTAVFKRQQYKSFKEINILQTPAMLKRLLRTQRVSKGIIETLKSSALGGILLILFTIIALIWANSDWKESYHHLWELPLGFTFGDFTFNMHLLHWVNDGLMAIFFYMVGLEIKREIITGELSSRKKATLPALGAIGGMLLPAVIYTLVNNGWGLPEAGRGWGVPMATDIAFSLGIISLLGKRVPLSLKVFLVALAIVDDLGAIMVIAIFYTSELNFQYLLAGLGLLAFLWVLNMFRFRKIPVIHVAGIIVWYCFYQSGVHATIAGVLLAFMTPIKRELDFSVFNKKRLEMQVNEADVTKDTLLRHHFEYLRLLRRQLKRVQSPVQRLEHDLHNTVNYIIMPVFALANAGVTFSGGAGAAVSSVTLGITLGLFFGKSVGITLLSWVGVKLGLAELPQGIKWKNLFAVSVLGGLGFTMAIFVANLAFTDSTMLDQGKVGIFLGSIISGLVGFYLLKYMYPSKNTEGNTEYK
jgi:Na+:H+ antiporter, NhaA family